MAGLEKFAFIIHPIDETFYSKKFPQLKYLPGRVVESIFKHVPPMKISHITGVKSAAGPEAEGWFVACPLTSRQMVTLPERFVLKRIIQAGKIAEKLGAKIVGLGAFTSVVGDAGITIARNLDIAVTTGNSYTVGAALQGLDIAAAKMGLSVEHSKVAVIGATGSIGSACARILARKVNDLTIAARNRDKLNALANRIMDETGLSVKVTTDVKAAVRSADMIITVTGAVEAVIEPEDLKPGAIVLDVARPRDVSKAVAKERPDVLVVEGGVIQVPGNVEFNFNFGFPRGLAYACMSETMILALEGRYESFSLGRDYPVERIDEITRLAAKHGFKLAGLRSFERALTEEDFAKVKEAVKRARVGRKLA